MAKTEPRSVEEDDRHLKLVARRQFGIIIDVPFDKIERHAELQRDELLARLVTERALALGDEQDFVPAEGCAFFAPFVFRFAA